MPSRPQALDLQLVDDVLKAAVREDVGSGDITSGATVPESARAVGRYTTKQQLTVSGLAVAGRLVELVDPQLRYIPIAADGDFADKGQVIAELEGAARSLLTVERVTLNILQRMCGIATRTREYVERVQGTKARVIDTRKTAPGLRLLDKYAVACGGGGNHRMGLFDAVLIKNNHIAFHPSIGQAVAAARRSLGSGVRVEIEVPRPEDVEEAIAAGASSILLDNFTPGQIREAARICNGRVPLEASGGITLETIREFAEAGADIISVGALTHSPPAADIHLRVEPRV